MKMSSENMWRILLLLYGAAVVFLCFAHFDPYQNVPNLILGIPIDKIVHFCMFLPSVPIVYFSLPSKWKTGGRWIRLPMVLLSALFCACAAGVVELLQGLTPYRSCELYDFVADSVGIGLAYIVTSIIVVIKRDTKNA